MTRTVVASAAEQVQLGLRTPFDPVEAHPAREATRRLLGAYYTPRSAADFMADWVVRRDGEHVLEPSFGDGIFLRAIAASTARRDLSAVRVSGIEIDEEVSARAVRHDLIAAGDAYHADFLTVPPFRVQAVIGNPPYVRLRHLANDQRNRALKAAEAATGRAMDPAGSLWMPFVLHAMRFLDVGGRLAFVLPYDVTYVRYARPLWHALGGCFGSLVVVRTHERLFPELLQDVVILLAEDFGSCTPAVRYRAFERVDDLVRDRVRVDETLRIDALQAGERVFVNALLGPDLRHLLATRIARATVPARQLVTFNIGYVAGDKAFFHPTDLDRRGYELPPTSLHPSLTSARLLRGAGIKTSSLNASHSDRLFLPDPKALTAGERRYIAEGVASGVSARYKCRIRDPWFVVPGTRVPDVVLTVFTERPILLVNDAQVFASNSLLCGYSLGDSGEAIAARWYTSLTLLQCELEVHALGGGVMVMVPREAGNVRLPGRVIAHPDHIQGLHRLLQLGRTDQAYRSGDGSVLIDQLGFSRDDVDLIRRGIDVLAHWRTSARSRLTPNGSSLDAAPAGGVVP